MGQVNIMTISFLSQQIQQMEQIILAKAKVNPEYENLLTVPGIGKVLGLTIMLETGEINRFPKVDNYVSYCRCVKSKRISNAKYKGENNRKNGNKYLEWAYVEGANFISRYSPEAKRWYQKKKDRTNSIVATKSLAGKLAKACYFMIKDQTPFDVKKLFG